MKFIPNVFAMTIFCYTFFNIVFVLCVDTIHITSIMSSHSVSELSAILFKYLLLSQWHVLGFQL